MSISYEKQPPLVSLADDDRRVIINTTNEVIAPGANAQLVIEFMNLPANNSTLILTWNNGQTTQVWEFVNGAPANDFQIQRPPDPFAMDAYEILITNIKNAFESNYQLSRIFEFSINFSSTDADITIAAKDVGDQYNLVVDGTSGVGSPIVIGENIEKRDNYKLRLLLQTYSKGNINQKEYEITQPPINEQCNFFISPGLISNLQTSPTPEFNMTSALDASAQVVRYRYKHAEQFGVPVVVGKTSALSSERFALPGGSSTSSPIQLIDYLDSKKLPTYRANKSIVYPGDQIILPAFIHLVGLPFTNLEMHVTITDQLGFQGTEVRLPRNNPVLGDLFYYPINDEIIINELGYDVDEVHSLNVQLIFSHSGSALSQQYLFTYMQRPVIDHRVFLFRNSFGVYEFFNTHGLFTRIAENESNQGRESNGRYFRHNVQRKKAFRVNTGFVEKQNMDFLADFLGSSEVYLMQGANKIPVTIEDMDVDIENVRMGHVNSAEFIISVEKGKYHGII